eukprot:jgi/Mesvir1/6695/Mv13729-RA.1
MTDRLRVNIGQPASTSDAAGVAAALGDHDVFGSPSAAYASSRAAFGPGDSAVLSRFPSSKLKLDELFLHWLSLPDSQRLVLSLLDDAKHGRPLLGPTSNHTSPTVGVGSPSAISPSNATNVLFSPVVTPPLSPKKGGLLPNNPLSPLSPISRPIRAESPLKRAGASHNIIPQFYFPEGRPGTSTAEADTLARVDEVFAPYPMGVGSMEFLAVTKEILKLPSFFNGPVFQRIDFEATGRVTKTMFLKWFVDGGFLKADPAARVFHCLRQPGARVLTQDDFRPILRELLATHPGLEFLQDTPEFQDRYAETVIYRIFYHLDRTGNDCISLRELKRSNLLDAMHKVDEEEDINKVLKYFSYEHFYVIYCKFWELDQDHDFLIDREDLLRYGNHALTYRIVERVFSQAPRKFRSQVEGKMNYEDFVWFILCEEDKTTRRSLEYWFHCVDLDSDGFITPSEMQYFYEEQLHRMECLSQEPVLFEDIVCQMTDMIHPAKEGRITLQDLENCRLSGNFFNILFNLNKFIAFETRDPFLIRQVRPRVMPCVVG